MKLSFLLLVALICPCVIHAQSQHDETAFRTSSVGLVYRPLQIHGITELLKQGGYPEFNKDWFLLQYARESEGVRAPDWTTWMNLGYSSKRRGRNEPNTVDASLTQVAVGIGYKVLNRQKLSMAAHLGMEMIVLRVRLRDRLVDTSNLSGYIITQESDEKSLSISQGCIRTGLRLRYQDGQGITCLGNLGYSIPTNRSETAHTRGSFGWTPDTRVGGFYAGLAIGLMRERCHND